MYEMSTEDQAVQKTRTDDEAAAMLILGQMMSKRSGNATVDEAVEEAEAECKEKLDKARKKYKEKLKEQEEECEEKLKEQEEECAEALADMMEKNLEYKNEANELITKKAMLQQRVSELETKLSMSPDERINKQVQDLKMEILTEKAQKKAADKIVFDLRAQVNDLEGENYRLKQENDRLRKVDFTFEIDQDTQKTREEIKSLQEKLKELSESNEELTQYKDTFDEVQSVFYKHMEEMNSMKSKIVNAAKSLKEAQDEKVARDAEISRLKKDNAAKDVEISQLNGDKAARDAEISQLKKDKAASDAKISRLEKDNSNKNAEIRQLKEDKREASAELEKLKQAKKLAEERPDTGENNSLLKERVEALNKKLQAKKKKIEEKESQIRSLNLEIRNLQETLGERLTKETARQLFETYRDVQLKFVNIFENLPGIQRELMTKIEELESMGTEEAKKIAKELAEKLKQIQSDDWQRLLYQYQEDFNNLYATYQRDYQALESNYEALQEKFRKLEFNITKLTNDNANLWAENERLQQNPQTNDLDLLEKLAKCERSLEDTKRQLEEANARANMLYQANTTGQAELAAAMQRISELEKRTISCTDNAEVDELTSKLKAARQSIAGLEARVRSDAAGFKLLIKQKETLFAKERRSLQSLIAKLEQTKSDDTAKLAELESQVSQLESQVSQLENELQNNKMLRDSIDEENKKEIQEKEAEIKEKEAEIQRKEAEIEKLTRQKDTSKDGESKVRKELEDLRQANRALNEELNNKINAEKLTDAVNAERERQIGNLKAELGKLKKEKEELGKQLETTKGESTTKNNEFDRLRQENAQLQEELAKRQGELAKLEKRLKETSDKRINRLKKSSGMSSPTKPKRKRSNGESKSERPAERTKRLKKEQFPRFLEVKRKLDKLLSQGTSSALLTTGKLEDFLDKTVDFKVSERDKTGPNKDAILVSELEQMLQQVNDDLNSLVNGKEFVYFNKEKTLNFVRMIEKFYEDFEAALKEEGRDLKSPAAKLSELPFKFQNLRF